MPVVQRPSPEGVVRFSEFEVDFRSGVVLKDGSRIKLQDQPFRILRVLLDHPGELVTREELQRQIWPSDTFVDFEKGLNNAIKRLREALGDSPEQPRFIETHPKRGYRFIGSVTAAVGVHETQEASVRSEVIEPAPWGVLYKRLAIGTLVFLLLIALLVGFFVSRKRLLGKESTPPIRSLAVLPLQNLSGDPAQEYFSDGLTDTLITDLAQIRSLKVISRTSSTRYRQTTKSLPEIARELNVDGIVEGTVQRSGNRVQINVQLIHGLTDKHLWAQSYEREVSDVFGLEKEVAQNIVQQVGSKITQVSHPSTDAQKSANEGALEAYLQGNFLLTRGEWSVNDDEKRKASSYFQKAIDADPDFELAYVGLAESHDNLRLGSAEDTLIRKRAAQKALDLNPNSANAHAILADLKWHNFEWAGAEEEYRKAVQAEPNNAAAHDGLGTLLAATGRLEDGLGECQIAQALDPNDDHFPPVLEPKAEYDRTAAMLLEMARNSPENGMINYELYRTYAASGKQKEAVEELEKALISFGMQDIAGAVQGSYAKSGYPAAMRTWAKGLEDLQRENSLFAPENIAAAYTAAGDIDRAFYWLEQAYEHREMVSHDWGLMILKVDPLLLPLRSDPRFGDLLRRIGLPP
jgi:TolB-like protein/DNA-binding winged helix-turn-helix (wHTH) protein